MKKLIFSVLLVFGTSNAFALSCLIQTGNGKYVCTGAGASGTCPGANAVSDQPCSAFGNGPITTVQYTAYVQQKIIRPL